MAEIAQPVAARGGSPVSIWRHVAVSVQGSGHELRGEPCQDSSMTAITDAGVLIAAVSDGAGSASRAQDGAAIAVETAMAFLARTLAEEPPDISFLVETVRQACLLAGEAIDRHAKQTKEPIEAFHATLVCAALAGNGAAVAHIGDSVAAIERSNGALELVSAPEHGEYVNSTFFLTQLPQQSERLHAQAIEGEITGVALSSDGLLEVAFHDPYGQCEPIEGFFGPIFRRTRAESDEAIVRERLTSLLVSPKIRSRTMDDVTLAIAVRIEKAVNVEEASREAFSLPASQYSLPNVVIDDDGLTE